jgi:hypothetical protein
MSAPVQLPPSRPTRGRLFRWGLPLAAALLLAVPGGCAPVAVPAPVSRMEVDDQEALARIGGDVPGFAGFEMRGEVVRLFLVDTMQAPAAEAAVRQLLATWRPDITVGVVEVFPARFDYLTLKEARDRLAGSGLYAVDGVVAAGISSGANRIVVQVTEESARRPVERILRRRGIPLEMVSITVTGPVVF